MDARLHKYSLLPMKAVPVYSLPWAAVPLVSVLAVEAKLSPPLLYGVLQMLEPEA